MSVTHNIYKNSKILIVEDDVVARTVMRQILETNGFVNIEEAYDGKEGWEKTLTFNPDLVLLDINMPVMNGLEYCKIAREHPLYKKMPILVQTGLSDIKEKQKIFAAGATDYVTKPLDVHEIKARSIIHLENSHYLRNLEEFNDRVTLEIQSAKRLLDISLPGEQFLDNIKNQHNIDIVSYFQSSNEMGGDFWGVNAIDENKIGFYIVDFSGHGIDSALNALRLDALIKSSPKETKDPAVLLKWLNDNFCSLLPPEQFATMFYGIIDKTSDTLLYATAAAPDMIILGGDGFCTPKIISGEGFPLGAVKQASYEVKSIPLLKKEILCLYSDSLIESPDSDGNFLSVAGIIERLRDTLSKNPQQSLKKRFGYFTYNFLNDYGGNITDDLTIILYCKA